MAFLEIVHFPAPVLRKKTKLVTDFSDPNLESLISDMAETMYEAPGVGLAANQIGLSLRLAVIDVDWKEEGGQKNLRVFINPILTEKSDPISFEEGCLSLPGLTGETKRFNKVTVEYQDLKGTKKTLNVEGLLAVALQHETDHLDGKLYIDRLSSLKKELLIKKFKKLKEERKSPE